MTFPIRRAKMDRAAHDGEHRGDLVRRMVPAVNGFAIVPLPR